MDFDDLFLLAFAIISSAIGGVLGWIFVEVLIGEYAFAEKFFIGGLLLAAIVGCAVLVFCIVRYLLR